LYATISETLEFVFGFKLGLFVGVGHALIERKINESKIWAVGTPNNHNCTFELFKSIPWEKPDGM